MAILPKLLDLAMPTIHIRKNTVSVTIVAGAVQVLVKLLCVLQQVQLLKNI
ncbi:hypothetical protein D3C79_991980 [compost metagenome]